MIVNNNLDRMCNVSGRGSVLLAARYLLYSLFYLKNEDSVSLQNVGALILDDTAANPTR
jgi:hypothetical protein